MSLSLNRWRKHLAVWPLLAVLSACLTGCGPLGQGSGDEQKEAHYLAGKSRMKDRDFRGAAEDFAKALEINPKSASAHLELGLLNYQAFNDYAAAVYHFQKYLGLHPRPNLVDTVNSMITQSKAELAKTVLPVPATPRMQRELDRLAAENLRLNQQLNEARIQMMMLSSNRQVQLNAFNSAATPATNVARSNVVASEQSRHLPGRGELPKVIERSQTPAPGGAVLSGGPKTRPYLIKAGENPSTIARKLGIKTSELLAANPGLKPERLQPGQTIQIPEK